MMKTGLVLEGGAHRAIYTAGVLDVLNENQITFDGVIGVSAGAIHGCAFVSKQKGRSIGYTLKYANNKHYMSFYSLLTTGNLVGEQFCYHDLPEKLFPFDHSTFEASNTKFYVTCTNLESGKPEYIYCDNLHEKMPYLRASASMPFVSRISHINSKYYLDGGISDSIPLKDMHGVVAITKIGGDMIDKSGKSSGILLAALISMNLAILNILPIPALDGGHLMFLLIEKITRKPLDEKVIELISTIFFSLLIILMILVVFNDITLLVKK